MKMQNEVREEIKEEDLTSSLQVNIAFACTLLIVEDQRTTGGRLGSFSSAILA